MTGQSLGCTYVIAAVMVEIMGRIYFFSYRIVIGTGKPRSCATSPRESKN
jgi:hypothetical protein